MSEVGKYKLFWCHTVEAERLEKALDHLRTENSRLSEKVAQLSAQLGDAEIKLTQIHAERDKLVGEVEALKSKLFRVVGTILVVKNGKFLITKRSADRPVFPSLWTIPGGGMEMSDFKNNPCDYQQGQWYNVLTKAMRRELMEETGLTVGRLIPITDLVFVRPDGIPVITFSWIGEYESGRVKLSSEDVDYAWITESEVGRFDLIPGIPQEIILAADILRRTYDLQHHKQLLAERDNVLEMARVALEGVCSSWKAQFGNRYEENSRVDKASKALAAINKLLPPKQKET